MNRSMKSHKKVPSIIVISGIDGSGKSTIISRLEESLQNQGRRTCTPWLRYNHYLTKMVFVLAKLVGCYRYDLKDGVRIAAYHEFQRSRIVSVLFVLATFVDTLSASLLRVYFPAYILRRTVICDRWVPDILVDIAIDTGERNFCRNVVWRMFWALVPSRAHSFVIMRERDEVLGCRAENRINQNFEERFHLYQELCLFGPCRSVSNDGTVNQAVQQILDVIE